MIDTNLLSSEKIKIMSKFLFGILLIFCLASMLNAQDTFSIVAVDPDTGEVGSAGASCVDGAGSIGGVQIISKLIPNRGGINGQAWICVNPHVNLDLGINEMMNGSSPEEIIQYLIDNDGCNAQNFNPEFRQYGIVDFDSDGNPRSAGFTGSSADEYKGHLLGENYAIQGNILLGPEILEQMEAGFLNTEGSLAEKLMAAMQGANVPGADSRCIERNTSSTSAFLMVAQADDEFLQPSLFLNVAEMPFGQEPIDSLQILFDEWSLSSSVGFNKAKNFQIYPNPTNGKIHIQNKQFTPYDQVEVYNSVGQMVLSTSVVYESNEIIGIELQELPIGAYMVKIKSKEEVLKIEKVIRI